VGIAAHGQQAHAATSRAVISASRWPWYRAAARVCSVTGPLLPGCVGVGTVYRRFGSRAGLVSALLDDRERDFQQAVMTGPPPLGPGATAQERIRAFLHTLLEFQEEQWQLRLLWEKDVVAHRYGSGPHQLYRAHLIALIREVDPDADAPYVSEALLALIRPGLINYEIREQHFTVERIKDGLDHLITRLCP
jgi:AcrR family transcriptional regulator